MVIIIETTIKHTDGQMRDQLTIGLREIVMIGNSTMRDRTITNTLLQKGNTRDEVEVLVHALQKGLDLRCIMAVQPKEFLNVCHHLNSQKEKLVLIMTRELIEARRTSEMTIIIKNGKLEIKTSGLLSRQQDLIHRWISHAMMIEAMLR